jgi:hypothetical protein
LHELWAAAYRLGVEEASDRLGIPPETPFGLEALIEAEGPGWIDGIFNNKQPAVNRSLMIAITEVCRGFNAGLVAVYRQQGITMFRWQTTSTDPCPLCVANQAAEPRTYGTIYPGGAADPPQHPNCDCELTGVS